MDVYNTDEAGLFFQMLPATMHTVKGNKGTGGKKRKLPSNSVAVLQHGWNHSRVTMLLCCNMDGTNLHLLLLIRKLKSYVVLWLGYVVRLSMQY